MMIRQTCLVQTGGNLSQRQYQEKPMRTVWYILSWSLPETPNLSDRNVNKRFKGSAKMLMLKRSLLITGMILLPSLGLSGAATDRLSVCLNQNTTYIDRLNLVRWIIKAYASHPAVQDLAAIPQKQRVEIDQIMAEIVQRLLSEDCPDEARTALVVDGDVALEAAFEVLGRSAGQSLLTDAVVNNEIMGFIDFVDEDKIEALKN